MVADRVTAHVGLGSNLTEPAARVGAALEALDQLHHTRLNAASRLYRTAPWGVSDQPDFVNAVAVIDTGLDPEELLEAFQRLESQAGRERGGTRWGPRTLDIDILLYGDLVSRDPALTLPHPRMHQRAFVLVPLLEVSPGIEIPGRGPASELLAGLDRSDVRPLGEAP